MEKADVGGHTGHPGYHSVAHQSIEALFKPLFEGSKIGSETQGKVKKLVEEMFKENPSLDWKLLQDRLQVLKGDLQVPLAAETIAGVLAGAILGDRGDQLSLDYIHDQGFEDLDSYLNHLTLAEKLKEASLAVPMGNDGHLAQEVADALRDLHLSPSEIARESSSTTPTDRDLGAVGGAGEKELLKGRESVIGTRDAPGPLMEKISQRRALLKERVEELERKLMGLEERFKALEKIEHPEMITQERRELSALSKSSRDFLKEYQEQDRALDALEERFFEREKLVFFSDVAEEREQQYEEFGAALLELFERKSPEEIDVDFALGDGSLSDLPGVCYTGWQERIGQKTAAFKELLGVSDIDKIAIMQRRSAFGAIREQLVRMCSETWDAHDVHYVGMLNVLFNDLFQLGLDIPSLEEREQGVYDLMHYHLVENAANLAKAKKEFEKEYLRFLPENLRNHFNANEDQEDKRAQLEALEQSIWLALRHHPQTRLDPGKKPKELYGALKSYCEEAPSKLRKGEQKPQEVLQKLKEHRSGFFNEELIFPKSKPPKRLLDLYEQVNGELQTVGRRHLAVFGRAFAVHPEQQLMQIIEQSHSFEQLSEELQNKLKRAYDSPLTAEEVIDILGQIRENLPSKEQVESTIADQNAAKIGPLAREGNALTSVGTTLYAGHKGLLRGPKVADREGRDPKVIAFECLMSVLYDQATKTEVEITQVEDLEALVHHFAKGEVLQFASSKLKRDHGLTREITLEYPQAYPYVDPSLRQDNFWFFEVLRGMEKKKLPHFLVLCAHEIDQNARIEKLIDRVDLLCRGDPTYDPTPNYAVLTQALKSDYRVVEAFIRLIPKHLSYAFTRELPRNHEGRFALNLTSSVALISKVPLGKRREIFQLLTREAQNNFASVRHAFDNASYNYKECKEIFQNIEMGILEKYERQLIKLLSSCLEGHQIERLFEERSSLGAMPVPAAGADRERMQPTPPLPPEEA